MSKRTTTLVWYSAIPLWLLISFARKNPEFIEKYYSRVFYPLVFDLHRHLLDLFPFSLGDILYFSLILYFLRAIFIKFPHYRVKPLSILGDFGSVVIVVAWIFHLSWGFNYHRLPLNQQFQIPIEYSEQDLEDRLDKIIEESNYWHNRLVSSDTMAVTFPNLMENILEKENDEIFKLLNCIQNICKVSKEYIINYIEIIKQLKDKKYNSKVRCKVMDIEDML